jgi:hypothetical protein
MCVENQPDRRRKRRTVHVVGETDRPRSARRGESEGRKSARRSPASPRESLRRR